MNECSAVFLGTNIKSGVEKNTVDFYQRGISKTSVGPTWETNHRNRTMGRWSCIDEFEKEKTKNLFKNDYKNKRKSYLKKI